MAAPKSLPSPSPERVSVFTFPTPLSDLLFWEKVDIANQRVWDMEKGDPHWDTVSYPSHKLVHKQPLDQGGKWQQYFYAAPRENQDAYNWEFSQADIGGTKFDSVVRTYVTLRSDYTPSTPAQGSAMPNVPAGLFGTGSGSPSVVTAYALSGRKELKLGNELDGLFVAEQLEWVKRTTIRSLGVDELNGKMLFSDETLWYSGEKVSTSPDVTIDAKFAAPADAYWGLQSNGTQRSGKQLTAAWFLVTTEQVIGGAFTDGLVSVDEVTTNENFYWPPVLNQIDTANIWDKREGGSEIYPAFRFEPEGYNGPTLCKVTRTWSISPHTIVAIPQMLPTSIHYGSPYYTINIPECLHIQVEIFCNIGNSDPVYSPKVDSNRKFTATNHTTWPSTIVGEDSQQPFRGGYLRTKKLFYSPTYPTSVGWT